MAAINLEDGPLGWFRWQIRAKRGFLSWMESEQGLISIYGDLEVVDRLLRETDYTQAKGLFLQLQG